MLPNSLLLWQRRLVHESLIEVIWEHLTLPVVARLIVAINHPLNGLKCFFRVDPGNQALACTKESMGRGRWYAVACICKTDHLQNRPSANQPTNQPAQNVSKLEFSSWDRGFWLCIANLHTCQWSCNIGIRSPCNNAPHTHKQRHTYILHTNEYFCTLYTIYVTQRNTGDVWPIDYLYAIHFLWPLVPVSEIR